MNTENGQNGHPSFELISDEIHEYGSYLYSSLGEKDERQPIPSVENFLGAIGVGYSFVKDINTETTHPILLQTPYFKGDPEQVAHTLIGGYGNLFTNPRANPLGKFLTPYEKEGFQISAEGLPFNGVDFFAGIAAHKTKEGYAPSFFVSSTVSIGYAVLPSTVSAARNAYSKPPQELTDIVDNLPKEPDALDQLANRAIMATFARGLPDLAAMNVVGEDVANQARDDASQGGQVIHLPRAVFSEPAIAATGN